mmetsp:Transcript_6206/g.17343  ORF Transcript_6206/g.17343 Transcript_6206/m.17343 type:complete len:395 (+) Transcript_6206:942-2126(+)
MDSSILSYGPCQTPTLTFCVQRHQRIVSFQPEPFWTIRPHIRKGGESVILEWSRGRVFDIEVGAMFHKQVLDSKKAVVKIVSEKNERKSRPHGLNTVEMLRIASTNLNMGPQQTMHVAERLYIQGYISYPRTESSAYPKHFDFQETLVDHTGHPIWGDYVKALLSKPLSPSKGGVDAGDHPPITPVRCTSEVQIGGGDEWRLYDYVTRHFLASLSSDAVVRKTKVTLTAAGETFTASGSAVLNPGFTTVMPWKSPEGCQLPALEEGEALPFKVHPAWALEATPCNAKIQIMFLSHDQLLNYWIAIEGGGAVQWEDCPAGLPHRSRAYHADGGVSACLAAEHSTAQPVQPYMAFSTSTSFSPSSKPRISTSDSGSIITRPWNLRVCLAIGMSCSL